MSHSYQGMVGISKFRGASKGPALQAGFLKIAVKLALLTFMHILLLFFFLVFSFSFFFLFFIIYWKPQKMEVALASLCFWDAQTCWVSAALFLSEHHSWRRKAMRRAVAAGLCRRLMLGFWCEVTGTHHGEVTEWRGDNFEIHHQRRMDGYFLEDAFWLAFPVTQHASGLSFLALSWYMSIKGQFLFIPQIVTHTIGSST